ncbi:hypothetical protein FGO68_gene13899 [Halteria grandinella]|uniref:Uncharacterized protein n=1 Tax=Halteria grandinella TaxID=5974 RepID=A0A8J8T865_HALGN|nr:hypothetical protein FGO68_gene13899 [Halteria grandinella]
MKRSDTEKVTLQKRKKVKALKYQIKVKQQEVESKSRQNTWLEFSNKANSKKEGHFAFKANQESIFKSPDTVMGKVGVVGSGKQMTQYEINKQKLTMLRDEKHFKVEQAEIGSASIEANKRGKY